MKDKESDSDSEDPDHNNVENIAIRAMKLVDNDEAQNAAQLSNMVTNELEKTKSKLE